MFQDLPIQANLPVLNEYKDTSWSEKISFIQYTVSHFLLIAVSVKPFGLKSFATLRKNKKHHIS